MTININSTVNYNHKKSMNDFLSSLLFNDLEGRVQFFVKERAKFDGVYEVQLAIDDYEVLFWKKIIFFRGDELNTNIHVFDEKMIKCMLSEDLIRFQYSKTGTEGVLVAKKYYFYKNEIIPIYILISEVDDNYTIKIVSGFDGSVLHCYSGGRGAIPLISDAVFNNEKKELIFNEVKEEFITRDAIAGSGVDELGEVQNLYLTFYNKTSKYETSFSINGENILTGFGRRIGNQLSSMMNMAGKGAKNLNPHYRYFSPSRVVSDPSTVSAHNFAHNFYQYLNDTYQYKGLDGNGGVIVSFPHTYANIGQSGANASYSIPTDEREGFIKYGEGYITTVDGADAEIALNPLRCYDVAIHELTHGITYNKLDGEIEFIGEPGGVNEFLSDLMAFLCTENWEFGENNIGSYFPSQGHNLPAWRSYSNPSSIYNIFTIDRFSYPEKYSDMYQGEEDLGGVHINITVPGKASWLMTMGGEHNGIVVNSPVGYEKMRQILFHSYKYLTTQSDYHDIRFAFIQSAIDLYPDDTWIIDTMSTAFDSVELFERTPALMP